MKTRILVATAVSLAWSLSAAAAGFAAGTSASPAESGRTDPLAELPPLDDMPRIPVVGKTVRKPDLHGPREIDRVSPERDIGPPVNPGVPDPGMSAGQIIPPFVSPGLAGGAAGAGMPPSPTALQAPVPGLPVMPMPPSPPRPISVP